MISVHYCGTYQDYSGYGDANRNDIASLFCAGVNTTTELVVQVPEKTDYGLPERICVKLQNRPIPYKIKIIHLTPDLLPRYMEGGKYHISRLMWETDRLPKLWVEPLNLVNEIWTASERQATMIKKSGVKVPVYWFPQALDVGKGDQEISPFEMKYKKDFIFYSVFQWIDRKNPRGLIRAYLRAFEGKNDVSLLLKTYRVNYSPGEFSKIISQVQEWKKELNLSHYPKIFITRKLLQHEGMEKLHKLGDVYVNSSSGEGWGRPVAEAMLYGRPVISADNGGITDYLTTDHYFRVPAIPKHITEQLHIPWYTQDMYWWEIKEDDLINMMRHVFEHREDIPDKVNRSKAWVMENLSYQAVGNKMRERLDQIERIL